MTVVLLAATLAPFHPGPQGAVPWTCVACSPDAGADLAANVAAFVPLGAALARARFTAARATAAGLMLSVVIESLQATGIAGRTAVLGDVLANAAGAAAGALLVTRAPRLRRPTPATARRLAAITAAGWVGLMTGSAWLLGRDPSGGPRPPRADVLATVPNFGYYHGRVAAFALDGWATGRRGVGPLVIAAPLGATSRARAALAGGDTRGGFVPAVAVLDETRRPAFLLGQRGAAAEVRVRRRARRWRLREPALVVPNALGALVEGELATRADVDVVLTPHQVALSVRPAGRTATAAAATLGSGPALGWSLVVPGARPWGSERGVLGAVWVAALLLPAAYWLGAAVAPMSAGRGRATAAIIGLTVVACGLAVGPALVGAARGAPGDWLASALALLLGWWGWRRLPGPAGRATLRA